jgi:protein deglycase
MSSKKTVLVPLADGFEEMEMIGIVDTLRRVGADVVIASITDSLQVVGAHSLNVVADKILRECLQTEYDMIVLPGGMPGAENLRDCAPLIKLLRVQKLSGRWYAAICASPAMVFAHHGLVDGLKVTCYPTMSDELKGAFFSKELVVVDKNCITSQGPGTALKFGVALVAALFGEAAAKRVGDGMLV